MEQLTLLAMELGKSSSLPRVLISHSPPNYYLIAPMGLEEAIDLRIKILDIDGDSALVINQIKDKWETYHPGLIPYRDYARRLLTFFNKVELHHIPRDQN